MGNTKATKDGDKKKISQTVLTMVHLEISHSIQKTP